MGNHKVLVKVNDKDIDITNNIAYNSNIGNINPIRYRGYYYDVESNLYYLNTRYYDPTIGRFINADEITILDETQSDIHGLNLYMYCGNNPVMNIDPSGRAWWNPFSWDWKEIGITFAAVVGVVAVVAGTIALSVFTGGLAGVALGAVATGIGIGATVGGVSAAVNGTSIAGGILGGAIKGGAMGAALGVGIFTGGGGFAALGAAGSIAAGVGSFVGAVGINFGAGMASYGVINSMNGKSTNWGDALRNGGLQAASGALAFGTGMIVGVAGLYNMKDAVKMFSKKWFGNIAGATFLKSVIMYPFTFVFDFFKK